MKETGAAMETLDRSIGLPTRPLGELTACNLRAPHASSETPTLVAKNGSVLHVNQSWKRLLGLEEPALSGGNVTLWMAPEYEETMQRAVQGRLDSPRRVTFFGATGTRTSAELRCTNHDGTVYVTAHPLDAPSPQLSTKLLFIDPERLLLAAMQRLLHKEYTVLTAKDTAQAHRALAHCAVDVILVDAHSLGLWLHAYLQRHRPGLLRRTIHMVSTLPDPQLEAFLGEPERHTVSKPIWRPELVTSIRAVLENPCS